MSIFDDEFYNIVDTEADEADNANVYTQSLLKKWESYMESLQNTYKRDGIHKRPIVSNCVDYSVTNEEITLNVKDISSHKNNIICPLEIVTSCPYPVSHINIHNTSNEDDYNVIFYTRDNITETDVCKLSTTLLNISKDINIRNVYLDGGTFVNIDAYIKFINLVHEYVPAKTLYINALTFVLANKDIKDISGFILSGILDKETATLNNFVKVSYMMLRYTC